MRRTYEVARGSLLPCASARRRSCAPLPPGTRRSLAGERRLAAWASLLLLLPLPLLAQDLGASGSVTTATSTRFSRTLLAMRAASPSVDGRLDDQAWTTAQPATDFVQFRPSAGEPASQRTEARIVYTESAIYVGARLYDTDPGAIIRRLARRDERTVADAFRVGFDSYYDRRTAFVFEVNASGVQRDWLQYDDTRQDDGWDAVWESATRVDDEGWIVEMRIPLSQLRFESPSEGSGSLTWGVNFQRDVARLDETSHWAPRPADGSRDVSAFGTLQGLTDLRPGRSLEVRPYLVTRASRAPGDAQNPFFRATDVGSTIGGDLRYGLTSNLTLNATVNPDFGQVEADPASVNLTAFETFLPEKRPFFQEGSDIFQFGLGGNSGGRGGGEQLFYSRRIGRSPQGRAPFGVAYSDVPEATTILGAAKLSGKTSSGWSVGVLNAVTGSENARFLDAEGIDGRSLVEPVTNYGVGRVSKSFRDGESAIGAIFTSVNRSIDEEGPVSSLTSSAYAGGIDLRHRFGGGDYEVAGFLLGSRIGGNAGSIGRIQRSSTHYFQRPDASHLSFDADRTSLFGTAASLRFGKIGGGNWRWGVSGSTRSPGFDVNALGFQRRADQVNAGASVGYESFRRSGIFRRWSLSLDGASSWTFGGERTGSEIGVGGSYQLTNFWGGYGGVEWNWDALSPTALRGGPAFRTPGGIRAYYGIRSDSRKAVRLGLGGGFSAESGTGSNSLRFSPSVGFQPSSRFELELQPSVSWNRQDAQYVTQRQATDGTRYVFGALDQTTVSLTTRLNYTFSPDLSIQLYAQPFVSAGSYDRFAQVADPRAAAFQDRFAAYGADQIAAISSNGAVTGYDVDRDLDGTSDFTFSNPDFNVKQFRSNLVLRWQYMPGSTLFLVWSQDRSDFDRDGNLRVGRDFDDLFSSPSTNVFLIKFEHWLGL